MFAEERLIKQGQNIHVVHGDDNGLIVEFSLEPVLDKQKTKEEGREIYRDVEFITIRIVGDTKTEVKRKVDYDGSANKPSDLQRFPRQWQAFKNKNLVVNEGTPINEWGAVGKALSMELKAMNIHTVEQLAAVSDGNLKWMGARELREKAKAWLAATKDNAAILKAEDENAALRREIEALKNQMAGFAKATKGKSVNGKDVSATDASGGE